MSPAESHQIIHVEPHPLLDAAIFDTNFPAPLGDPSHRSTLHMLTEPAPVSSSDVVRSAVRDLLRHGGYKPTGRGKPASEYLLRAVTDAALGSINLAVDLCNVVSFHSGLPISVVDADKLQGAARVAVAPPGTSYVFNQSGQTIDLGGLLCLGDEEGLCANAVKDSQRTKTSALTRRTRTVIWGTRALPGLTEQVYSWYEALLIASAATVMRVIPLVVAREERN